MTSMRCITPSRSATPRAALAIHADRMDFVDIGHRAVFLGEVADRADRRDVAVHRIDALEQDQLRPVRIAASISSSSRWARSLWRKIFFSQPDCRTPSIIELWL